MLSLTQQVSIELLVEQQAVEQLLSFITFSRLHFLII